MNKPLSFPSLAALVEEYRVSYEDCYHKVGHLCAWMPLAPCPPRGLSAAVVCPELEP